jgi:hypothetical protein
MKRQLLWVYCLLALPVVISLPAPAVAGSFVGSQTGPTLWTYTLTYDPLDNYSIFQPYTTTITLTGLFGVTGATPPTSTDFVEPWINSVNLNWTPSVSAGGTEVVWTHDGPGTGNFGVPMGVYGFTISATAAVDGTVPVATEGFSRDMTNPLPNGTFDVDFTGATHGPVANPIPEPATLLLFGSGLFGLANRWRKRRLA